MPVTVMYKCEHPAVVMNNRVCLGNTHVLTGCMDGKARLFNSKTGEMVRIFLDQELTSTPMSVTGLSVLKNDIHATSFVASYSEGLLKYWDFTNGSCLRTLQENRQIMGLAQNPRDRHYLSLGADGVMHYYDFETSKKIRSFMSSSSDKMDGHTSRVFSAIFHPNQVNEFVSGGWDNTVLFWDIRKPTAFRSILGPHICGEGLDIDPTGHLILTCSYTNDNPAELFEYNTGKTYLKLEYEGNKLYCGKWLAPMYLAIGSSDPSVLKVFNMFSIKEIMNHKTNDSGIFSIDEINLKSKNKQFKEGNLSSVIMFTSGTSFISLKIEHTHFKLN